MEIKVLINKELKNKENIGLIKTFTNNPDTNIIRFHLLNDKFNLLYINPNLGKLEVNIGNITEKFGLDYDEMFFNMSSEDIIEFKNIMDTIIAESLQQSRNNESLQLNNNDGNLTLNLKDSRTAIILSINNEKNKLTYRFNLKQDFNFKYLEKIQEVETKAIQNYNKINITDDIIKNINNIISIKNIVPKIEVEFISTEFVIGKFNMVYYNNSEFKYNILFSSSFLDYLTLLVKNKADIYESYTHQALIYNNGIISLFLNSLRPDQQNYNNQIESFKQTINGFTQKGPSFKVESSYINLIIRKFGDLLKTYKEVKTYFIFDKKNFKIIMSKDKSLDQETDISGIYKVSENELQNINNIPEILDLSLIPDAAISNNPENIITVYTNNNMSYVSWNCYEYLTVLD